MFNTKEKGFFSTVLWGVSKLSTCPKPEGALLVGSHGRILGYGCNVRVSPGNDTSELSAIHIAFQNSGTEACGATLFSTRWPTMLEMKLILGLKVSPVYFFGPVNDPESVRLVNDFNEFSHNSLETIKLELSTSS